MDWMELVASVISSLAWPVVAATVVVLFRKQLRNALEQPLRRFKLGPVEAEWDKSAEQVVVAAASSGARTIAPDYESELDRLKRFADITPVPAVRDSYELVHRELQRIASEASVAEQADADTPSLVKALREAEVIDDETVSAVRGLTVLRKLAAHDDGSGLSVTPERAREYVSLTEATLFALSRASVRPVADSAA